MCYVLVTGDDDNDDDIDYDYSCDNDNGYDDDDGSDNDYDDDGCNIINIYQASYLVEISSKKLAQC